MLLPVVVTMLSVWLSPVLSDTDKNGAQQSLQYQYHPYHQRHYPQYQRKQQHYYPSENRRHQRTFVTPKHLRNPSFKLKNTPSSKHFSSPAYRFQPQLHKQQQRKPVLTERQQRFLPQPLAQKYQRRPILIQPGKQKVVPRIVTSKRPIQAANNRNTRKIASTPLKIGGKAIKSKDTKKKYKHDEVKKDKNKLALKNDNLAIESNIVETKVKLPNTKLTPDAHNTKSKPQLVKKPAKGYPSKKVKPVKVPIKRNYNSAPAAPKFIIKQAGPSQQFGWVGHGTYAPLNIPNIFKAAGLNTRWIPEVDEIFETGLTYPASPVAYAQDKLRIVEPEQQTKPVQTYSASASPIRVSSASASINSHTTGTNVPTYEAPAPAPAYEAPRSVSAYKASSSVSTSTYEAPASAPSYKAPVILSTDEAASYSAPAPSYSAPAPVTTYSSSSTSTAAPALSYSSPVPTNSAPSTTHYAPAPSFSAPVPSYSSPAQSYSVAAPAPIYSSPSSADLPAIPPNYSPSTSNKPSKPFSVFNVQTRPDSYGAQSIDLFSSSVKTTAAPFYKLISTVKATTTYKPIPTYKKRTTNKPSTTIKPITTHKSITTYKPITTPAPPKYSAGTPKYVSTAAPFFGSPTPSIFKSSPGYFVPQPSYQPSRGYPSTNKPFTAFIGSSEPAPSLSDTATVRTIEASPKDVKTAANINLGEYKNNIQSAPAADDGEVFYIFYENEENPLDSVKSGLDLQRYIHEEIKSAKEDSDFSASISHAEIFEDDVNGPELSAVEKFNKPKQPIYFDVPIKIEENGEGFDPPSEIRTIFVPIENAINIPDTFDISVGTSFGYNKNKESFPNFSADSDSSYNNPISSYDAPIAPNSQGSSFSDLSSGKDSVNFYENPGKKSLRRIRKPKPKSIRNFSSDIAKSSLASSIPFGTRLGPRDQYDPLIIKR